MKEKVRVSVAGASGYAGAELVRLLLTHPGAEMVHLAAGAQAGRPLAEVFPSLRGFVPGNLLATDWQRLGTESDVVFLCLPHGQAMSAAALFASNARVVDLGADFRLRDLEVFRRWYGEHTSPGLVSEAVYGLPEIHRERIRQARLVAVPGCYPTAAALALLPLKDLIDGQTIFVDAKSGVSGAGRKATLGNSFAELSENLRPYSVFAHRHGPEMEQALADEGARARIAFAPHLVPMPRGILAACYLALSPDEVPKQEAVQELYERRYADEPFVRILPPEALPETKAVRGSNFCDVAFRIDAERGALVAFAAIDNLVKGAAGQALQCFNLMFGFDERTGLLGAPLYP